MSIHADLTPEALVLLRKQERKSRILSGIIACMTLLLIAGVLALFAIPMMTVDTPVIVTYAAESREEPELQEKKVVHQTQRKQAAPAQNLAKVIAAATAAPTAIPVPDVAVSEPSMLFGDDIDFGQGWGDDAFEDGGASFFGQQVKAQRIAYVIDYSGSMVQGDRDKLMREELTRSVSELPPGVVYQLIFFAGPGWVAGDQVQVRGKKATVTSGKDKYEWETSHSYGQWDVAGKKVQTPVWRSVTTQNIEESLKHIKNTQLVLGTVWMPPMEMALRMDPPPQVIYFMTDGIVGGRDVVQLAKDIAKLARSKGTRVNTIALMEPKAREAMITLANETGGEALMVREDGSRQVLRDK